MSVCVLGSINVDLVVTVTALPRPGETVLASGLARLPGGKGANQAVAAARMGAPTRLLGTVGEDEAGQWMLDTLAGYGVDLSAVVAKADEPTGTALIAVDSAAENQIIVAPGANRLLAAALPPPQAPGEVLLAQLEVPLAALAAAFAQGGRYRILNAAPAVPEAAAMFGDVDLLIVNQHELASYLGVDAVADVRAATGARALLTRPDQAVVVTLGPGGAVAVWQDHAFHAPALPVTPLDTVGAGDCFCGALAALLAEGRDLRGALPLANAAAALCTQARGAAPAMPNRAEVEAAATEYARGIKKAGGVVLK